MSDPTQAQPSTQQVEQSSATGAQPTPETPSSSSQSEPTVAAGSAEGGASGAAGGSPETTGESASSAPGTTGVSTPAAGQDAAATPTTTTAPDAAAPPAGEAGAADAEAGAARAEAGESDGDGQKRKRRRRRRRKPGQAGEGEGEGAEAATVEAATEDPAAAAGSGMPRPRAKKEKREKKEPSGVFNHLFESGAPRKHAFAASEVVAGRVLRVDQGVAVVDLFGKATAFIDVLEPRDVPILPEKPAEPEPVVATAAEGATAPQDTSEPVAAEQNAASSAESPAVGSGVESDPALSAQVTEADGSGAEAAAKTVEASVATSTEVAEAPAVEAVDPPGEAPTAEAEAEAAPAEASPAAAPQAPAEAGDAAVSSIVDSALPPPELTAAVEPEPQASAGGETAVLEAPVAEEVAPAPPPEPPTAGQIMRGRIGSVAESGHIILVNRIIDRPAAKAKIRAARDAKERVEGIVYGFNRGGFDVLVEGVRVFCPARSMSLGPIANPEQMLGAKVEFTVSPSKGSGSSLVVGRRGILEREQRKQAKSLLKSLEPGQRLTGTVTQVREFGVFVDIGGVEGLVHQSELTHSRGVRPGDVAKPGDTVEVQVLKLGEGSNRKDRDRVSLSMRALQPDPWDAHTELLKAGSVREAKVVRLTDFGAFMELAPQIEGLLHISELGREVKHASAVLTQGETIHVVVERVDRGQRRISLSKLSPAEQAAIEAGNGPDPEAKLPKPGKQVKVTVDRVEPAGVVVRVPGIYGKRGRGFIPNSEMGTERGTDHRKMCPVGLEMEVKVIGTDRDGGLRCSKKALVLDEEKRAVQDYRKEVAKQGLGTFGDLLRSKLGASKDS